MVLTVAAGGALGSLGRWALAGALPEAADGWPWGTLLVNVTGALAMGLLIAWLADRGQEAALDALLETHLFTWSDTYLDQLGRAARHPFYQCLAALTRITLHDMQERRCRPVHQ